MAIAFDTAQGIVDSTSSTTHTFAVAVGIGNSTLFPTSGTDDSTVGTITWSNPGNITAQDTSRATATASGTASTHYVKGSSYGFAIPSGVTITGIVVTVGKFRNGGATGQIRDNSVRLLKGGVYTGSDYADTSTNWTTGQSTITYGGTTDLWGTTWTDTDINASNFGAALSAKGTVAGTDRVANVDYIIITVYYNNGVTIANQCMVIGVTAGFTPSVATIDGNALVLQQSNTSPVYYTYSYAGLTSGWHTLSFTIPSTSTMSMIYSSWVGVDQTTPVEVVSTVSTGFASSGSASVTTLTAADILVEYLVGSFLGTYAYTTLATVTPPSLHSGYTSAPTAGSYTMTESGVSTTNYAIGILALKPAGGGTSYTSTLTETITNSDVLIRVNVRNLTESLTNTDTFIRSTARTLSETLTNTASVLKSSVRTLVESVTNTDVFTSVKSKVQILTETLTNTDTLIRSLGRTLTEAITNTATFTSVVPLSSGLKSYWKLDESSGTAADSVGTETLTLQASTTFATGKINNGITQSSASSVGAVGATSGNLDFTQYPLAVSAWFNTSRNTSVPNGDMMIFSKQQTASPFDRFTLSVDPTTGFAKGGYFGSGTSGSITGASALNNSAWHHAVFTISSSGGGTLYIDGSSVGTTTYSGTLGTTKKTTLGINWDVSTNNPFYGSLDEIGVWNRELTSAEVTRLYASGAGSQYPFGTAYTQTLTEAITNTAIFVRSLVRTLSETITNTATLVRTLSRTLTQTITNTDTLVRSSVRTLLETVTNTDVLTTFKGNIRTLTETITNTDTFTRLFNVIRTFTENITNTDVFSTGSTRALALLEQITNTDTVVRSVTKVLTEIVTNTDSLIRTLVRTLSESITNTATLLTIKTYIRTLTETITNTATFTKVFTAVRTFTETITNTDTIRKLLNGSSVLWSHVVKASSTTWNKVSQATASTWTKVSKNTSSWTHTDKS